MKVVVITGAGISAESGLQTFRSSKGLWNDYRIEEVASLEGWQRDKARVLDFYNQRRRQLKTVEPNQAHHALYTLERTDDVTIITQNVDDLHERAGSTKVLHLHGELLKARSSRYDHLVYDWHKDIHPGDTCEKGFQLRPHIVWFGESVPLMADAHAEVQEAEAILVIGTSLQVYPAASLLFQIPRRIPVFYVDPDASRNLGTLLDENIEIIEETATIGVPLAINKLKNAGID